jgi:hypothetical protein
MFSFTQPSFNTDTDSVAGGPCPQHLHLIFLPVEGCLFKSGPSHSSIERFLLASALVHFYFFTWSKRSIEHGPKSSRPINVVRRILDLSTSHKLQPHQTIPNSLIHRTRFQTFTDLVAGGLRPQNLEMLWGFTTWEVACSTQARVMEISEPRDDFLLLILLQ